MFDNSEDLILNQGQVWHGAAVAWHTDLHYAVTELPATHDRFAAVILNISGSTVILAISLYAPTAGKDEDFLECLGYLEEFLVLNTPENCAVLSLTHYELPISLLNPICRRSRDMVTI